MRIKNKYVRNRSFKNKAWNRIRRQENPYEHTHGAWWYTTEEQIAHNLEQITKRARAIDSGSHKHWNHASASFRRQINKERKAQERNVMAVVRNGNYDAEFPTFKRDADWLYF